jgi:hypothetical protein
VHEFLEPLKRHDEDAVVWPFVTWPAEAALLAVAVGFDRPEEVSVSWQES